MDDVEEFMRRVPDVGERSAAEFIELFVYFLTVEQGKPIASVSQVKASFEATGIPAYSNISQYFLRHSSGKSARFVKRSKGYCLARSRRIELDGILGTDKAFQETATSLRGLLELLPTENERDFLKETIDCYEVGAFRAAIVMGWLLAISHLFEYILAKRLPDFNAQLAKVKDKSVKVYSVSKKDDFSEIPESKFIEICRSAKIISVDVRKILDEKLGIRNSYAHPSDIKVSQNKATEFLNDLVHNVVDKYKV